MSKDKMTKKILKNKIKGQVAIEMAASLIAVFIFLLGTLQIFVWFNSVLVGRQQYYQATRQKAADYDFTRGGTIGGYAWEAPALDVLPYCPRNCRATASSCIASAKLVTCPPLDPDCWIQDCRDCMSASADCSGCASMCSN